MSENWYPIINYDKCIGCNACINKCKRGVYQISSNAKPKVVKPDNCVEGCHSCGNSCPTNAITYFGDDGSNEKINSCGGCSSMNNKDNPTIKNLKANETCGCNTGCSCNENSESVKLPAKNLNIDFLYLDLNTCERCVATGDTLNEALNILSPVFKSLNYEVKVNKVNITTRELAKQYRFVSSPTIRVNGIDICTELKESNCKACSDLGGCSVDCRVFVYDGVDYEQPPAAMIVDGILHVLHGHPKYEEKPYTLPDNLENYFSGSEGESIMKNMQIFEPAMCCETGMCGVSVNSELLRVSTVLNTLKKKGIIVKRFNLNSAPMEFVNNKIVNEFVNSKGPEELPVVLLEGKIIMSGRYPTNEEFTKLLDFPEGLLKSSNNNKKSCDCKGGC